MSDQRSKILERVRASQASGLSLPDLLAVGLSRHEEDVEATSDDVRKLLRRFTSPGLFSQLSIADLKGMGLDDFEALQRLALIEVGRQMANAGPGARELISDPTPLVQRYHWLRKEAKEHFMAAFLDTKGYLIAETTIHIGTLNASLVGPREVFREALRFAAASVIVVHNHPSGDPTPSPEDCAVTRTLVEAGRMLDIPLSDHLILGDPEWVSLRRMKLL